MASEPKRGCGYRKVGGLYLRGGLISAPCDRLPYAIGLCPTCGEGCQFTRSYKEINPLKRFGIHSDTEFCEDSQQCFMCYPPDEVAYLMWVGVRHYKTPEEFTREALELGVSKRIDSIPKKLVPGKTVIYLAHNKACMVTNKPGIFSAFIPQAIEKIYWQSEIDNMTEKEKEKLERRGITPVGIPDGDGDHA